MNNIADDIHNAYEEGYEQGKFDAIMEIDNGKAVCNGYTVKAVVLCKNCKYREDKLYCRLHKDRPVITTNVDFCSYGEVK